MKKALWTALLFLLIVSFACHASAVGGFVFRTEESISKQEPTGEEETIDEEETINEENKDEQDEQEVLQDLPVITLSKTELILAKGDSQRVKISYDAAKYGNAVKTVWQTSDRKIALVDGGMITAYNPGQVDIICSVTFQNDVTVTAVCSVDVYQPVLSITARNTNLKLIAGETSNPIELTIKPEVALYKAVTWSSNNASIASVDSKGRIAAKKGGKATITATLNEPGITKQKSITFNVTVIQNAEKISISKSSVTLGTSKTHKLSATVTPTSTTNKNVVWSSSNPRIATVDEYGLVTAKNFGNCFIICTTTDGSNLSARCHVTVTRQVSSIKARRSPSTINMVSGSRQTIAIDVVPEEATNRDINWTSSNEEVATCEGNSNYVLIRAVGSGTAKITGTAADHSGARITITVNVEAKFAIALTGRAQYERNDGVRYISLEVKNTGRSRKVSSFTLRYYAIDENGKKIAGKRPGVYEFEETIKMNLAPGVTRYTPMFKIANAENAKKIYYAIKSVRYADGSIAEASELRYLGYHK